ncbi:DNA-binding response OmpR family regulator [Sediminitomix flava]|uniref:histidine kinase n=2 Tax=Sediminitomix flava TaxID=379075 RepID=A0A315ZCB4_SEDFL|nr:DNA-binding response OmpR family regulator [Sediminitomix flava]
MPWGVIGFTFGLIISLFLMWRMRQQLLKKKKEHDLNTFKIGLYENVNDELKTQLGLMMSSLDKLLKTNFKNGKDTQHLLISENTKRLQQQVDQLLAIQKFGTEKLELNKTLANLVEFTEKRVSSFEVLSKSKNIDFVFQTNESECVCLLDYNKFDKILYNLISIAFEHTPDFGRVSLELHIERASLTLKLKDSEIGIQTEHLNKLFNQSTTINLLEKKEDYGLGLTLTKEYVELHKGTIELESKIGEGCCFIVRLPLEYEQTDVKSTILAPSENDIEVSSSIKHNRKTPLILVVEDNDDFRFFLTTSLKENYRIIEASDGQEGFEQAIREQPDLIISDFVMPIMNGNTLCKKLKSDAKTAHIPIILLTAQTEEHYQVQVFESGADQYVSKPLNFEVLESRIRSLLTQRDQLQKAFSKKIAAEPTEVSITSIDEQLVQKALEYVEQHISKTDLSVEELSLALDINRVQLYRKITSLTGKSPSDFIRSVRLKRAAQLLNSSELNISEIAYEVGFLNPKYFSKCFKVEYGISPTTYLNNQRKNT